MTDGLAPRDKPGDSDPKGIGAQATLRSSEIRGQASGPLNTSPEGAPGTLEIGAKLEGVYEVKRLLGKGAMGAVYLVEHTGLGKEFAAKVVGGSRALDTAAVARLRNEARIASSIEHENIVNVTHLGQTGDGTVFIVMELLRGEDLRHRMERQLEEAETKAGTTWLPDNEVRDIVGPVLSGLAAAHAAGVIHRDLKPDNIFLAQIRGKMKPKLVDFGIGKLRAGDHKDLRLTETGQIIGTPLYMAPEQTRSTSQVDHRADLYSLAVMVFEMVCGRPPFEAGHLFEIVIKHATEPAPDPREFRPDLPASVAELINRTLRKEPNERWTSADEMLEAWTKAWEDAGLPAAWIRPSVVSDPGTTGGVRAIATAELADSGSRTGDMTLPRAGPSVGRLAAIGAIVLGCVALAWVGVSGLGGDGDVTAPPAPVARIDPVPLSEPPLVVAPPLEVVVPVPDSLPVGADPPATRHHTVTTTPAGAEVVRDGVVLGRTPFELDLPAGETADIEFRLDGYRSAHHAITPDEPAVVETRLRPRGGGSNSGGSTGGDFPGLAPR